MKRGLLAVIMCVLTTLATSHAAALEAMNSTVTTRRVLRVVRVRKCTINFFSVGIHCNFLCDDSMREG